MNNLPFSLDDIMETRTLTWEQMETVRLLKGLPGTYYQQATSTERAVMRDWLRSIMQQQAITVTFVKNDGTVRDMLCTLNQDFIPSAALPKNNVPIIGAAADSSAPGKGNLSIDSQVTTATAKPDEPETMRVFDVEKQQWRSFRYDRVQKISVTMPWQ